MDKWNECSSELGAKDRVDSTHLRVKELLVRIS